jgi:hypothetical protein
MLQVFYELLHNVEHDEHVAGRETLRHCRVAVGDEKAADDAGAVAALCEAAGFRTTPKIVKDVRGSESNCEQDSR